MNDKTPAFQIQDEYKQKILKSFSNKTKENEQNRLQHLSEFDNRWNMNNKIIELFENKIEKDQKLRVSYAKILIFILIIELIFLIVIFILTGCGILKYSDITFNLFITGGIAEVFYLVKIIVKYLFKDNLTSALNIILKNNNKLRYKKKKYNKKTSDKPRVI